MGTPAKEQRNKLIVWALKHGATSKQLSIYYCIVEQRVNFIFEREVGLTIREWRKEHKVIIPRPEKKCLNKLCDNMTSRPKFCSSRCKFLYHYLATNRKDQ